jgi:hypothetical protein
MLVPEAAVRELQLVRPHLTAEYPCDASDPKTSTVYQIENLPF